MSILWEIGKRLKYHVLHQTFPTDFSSLLGVPPPQVIIIPDGQMARFWKLDTVAETMISQVTGVFVNPKMKEQGVLVCLGDGGGSRVEVECFPSIHTWGLSLNPSTLNNNNTKQTNNSTPPPKIPRTNKNQNKTPQNQVGGARPLCGSAVFVMSGSECSYQGMT